MAENAYIHYDNVGKVFFDKKEQQIVVLNDFTFLVKKGEFITFFGPNGCGKTTLLNITAGLLDSDSGLVQINNKSPIKSKIGFVFQNYHNSLLPWRTNLDNVALPLELEGMDKKQRSRMIKDFIDRFEISIPLDSYPYQLSGGQQQLLCIARALISNPDVLLMDEPFNQLDFQTRIEMNNKLQDIWMKTSTTIIFVSHDLEEAVALADRLIILTKRPAKIKEIINNSLPRPRKTKILQGEDFFQIKSKALKVFEEVLKE